MPVHILLFAAGASTRMGGLDKLTQPIAGEPLLRRVARQAAASGLPVVVLLPPGSPERRAALEGLRLETVTVLRASFGMAESIRAGLAALPASASGAVMLLADMPDLSADDLRLLASRFAEEGGDTVCRAASEDGRPGAPAVVPRRLFPALAALEGDTGGRQVLKREAEVLVPLPGERALVDLDTPEDWAAWRARPIDEP